MVVDSVLSWARRRAGRERLARSRAAGRSVRMRSWVERLDENHFHVKALQLYSLLALVSTLEPAHHWTAARLPSLSLGTPRGPNGHAATARCPSSQGHPTV